MNESAILSVATLTLFVLAAIFSIAAAVLFFKLDVRAAIAFLRGRRSPKTQTKSKAPVYRKVFARAEKQGGFVPKAVCAAKEIQHLPNSILHDEAELPTQILDKEADLPTILLSEIHTEKKTG